MKRADTLVSLMLLTIPVAASAQSGTETDEGWTIDRPDFQFLRFNEDYSSYRDAPRDELGFFDSIKHIPLNEAGDAYLSIGGRTRARFEAWDNFGFGAPANDSDEFLLWRAFLHADFHLGENLRVFVEGKTAQSTDRDLPGGRRTLDVDSLELQQAFADITFDLSGSATLTLRPGRQELLFGKQRLVSPLPWGNTLRHWDGVSAIYKRDGFKAHAFWTEFVPTDKYRFNTADTERDFYGLYTTTAIEEIDGGLDLYYLGFHNQSVAFNGTAGDEERHTLGGRLFGKFGDGLFDYDLEGAYQFGEVGAGDVSAYFIAAQLGFTPEDIDWNPRFYVGFDYASGDDSPGGDVETFNQLFPLGHAYFGFIDTVGRQNIIDASTGVRFKPTDKLTAGVDAHFFFRAEESDALYNAGGGVVRAPGGSTSNEVGAEIDLTLNYQLNRNTTIGAGYSHFFPGEFIEETGEGDAIDFFYTQIIITF